MKATRKTFEKINKTQSSSFEKTVKFDKPSAKLTKTKKEKSQIIRIRKRRGLYYLIFTVKILSLPMTRVSSQASYLN